MAQGNGVEVPLLRTSERSEWGRCRWAWDKAYVQCIKPAVSSPPLRFGSLVHLALAAYYKKGIKRGVHPAITFAKEYERELKEQTKLGFRDEDGKWNDAAALGEIMLNGYVDNYSNDAWRVLATEMPFRVPVMHPRTGKLWFMYAGVIDLVAEDRSTKFTGLVDHKTTKDDPSGKIDYLNLDEQAGAYWRYGRQALYDLGLLRQDQDLNGITFNYLKKKEPDERDRDAEGYCLNKDGTRSKTQPGPLFFRFPVYRNDIEGENVHQRVLEQFREMSLARRGKLAIYKTPGSLMGGACHLCGFKDMCELHESGADWEAVRDATMAPWDPYAEHEVLDGERR